MGIIASSLPESQDQSKNTTNPSTLRLVVNGNAYKVSPKDLQDQVVLSNNPKVISLLQAVRLTKEIDSLQLSLPQQQLDEFLKSSSGSVFTLDQNQPNRKTSNKSEQSYSILGQLSPAAIQQRGRALPIRSAYVHAEGKENDQKTQNLGNNENATINKINQKKIPVIGGMTSNVLIQASSNALLPVVRPFQCAYTNSSSLSAQQDQTTQIAGDPPLAVSESSAPIDPYILPSTAFLASLNSHTIASNINTTMGTSPFTTSALNPPARTTTTAPSNLLNISAAFPYSRPLVVSGPTQSSSSSSSVVPLPLSSSLALKNTLVSSLNTADSKLISSIPFSSSATAYILNTPTKAPAVTTANPTKPTSYLAEITLPPKGQLFTSTTVPFSARSSSIEENISSQIKTESSQSYLNQERQYLNPRSSSSCGYRSSVALNKPLETINISDYLSQCKQNKANKEFINNQSPILSSVRASQSLHKVQNDPQTSNQYAPSREEQAECNFQAAQQLIESANMNIAQATRISMPNMPKITGIQSNLKTSTAGINLSSQQASHTYTTPVSQNKTNQGNTFVEQSGLSKSLSKTKSFNQLPPSIPYYFGKQQPPSQSSQRGHQQQALFESDHYLRTSSSSISQMDQDGMNCFQQSNSSNTRWCQLQSSLSPIPKIANGNILATDNSRSMMSESIQHNTTTAPIILSSRKSTEACERSMRQSSSTARDAISKIIHETVSREVDNLKKINESSLQKHLRENQHKMNAFLDKQDSRQRLQSLHNSRELNKSFSDISASMKNAQQSLNNNNNINDNNNNNLQSHCGQLTPGEQPTNIKTDPFNATWRMNNHSISKQITSSSSQSLMPQNNQSFYRTAAFNNNNSTSHNIASGQSNRQGESSRRQSSCYEGELFQGDMHLDMHSQQQKFVIERQRHVSIMSDLDIQTLEQNQQKESQYQQEQRQSEYDRQEQQQQYGQLQFAQSHGHPNTNNNNNNQSSSQYSPIEQNHFQHQPSAAATGLFLQSSVGKECSGWLEKQPMIDMSPYSGGANGMYDEPLAARDLTGENEEQGQQQDSLIEEGYYDDLESQADNGEDISNNDIDDVSENRQEEDDRGDEGYEQQQDQENIDEFYEEDYQHGGYDQQQIGQLRNNYNDQGLRNLNSNQNIDYGGDLMQTLSSGCTFQPASFGYTTSTVKQSQKLLSFSPLPQNQLIMQSGLQSQLMNNHNEDDYDDDNEQDEQEEEGDQEQQYEDDDDEGGQTSLSQISLSPLRPSSPRIDGEEEEEEDQQMMYYCNNGDQGQQQNQYDQGIQQGYYNNPRNNQYTNLNQLRDQQLQGSNQQFDQYEQQQQLGQFEEQEEQGQIEQNRNGSDFEDQYDGDDGYDCQEELNEYSQNEQQQQFQQQEQDIWQHQQSVYQPQQQRMLEEGELYDDQSDAQDDDKDNANNDDAGYENVHDHLQWENELQEVEQRFIASRQQQRDLSEQYNQYLAQMQSQVTSSNKKRNILKDSYGMMMRNSEEGGVDIKQASKARVTNGLSDQLNRRIMSGNELQQQANNGVITVMNTATVSSRLSGNIPKEAKGSCDNHSNNNNDDFIAELESISLRSARGLMSLSQRIQHSNSSLVLDKSNIHDETAAIPARNNDLQRLSEYVISSGNHQKDNTHEPSPVRNRCVSLDGQNAKHKRNTGRFGYHRQRDQTLSFDPLNCTAHEIMSYMHATNATIQQKKNEEGNPQEINEQEHQQEKMNQEQNEGMKRNKESISEQEQKVFTDSMRKNKAAADGESQKKNEKNIMDQLQEIEDTQEKAQLQETFKVIENINTTEGIGEYQKQERGLFGAQRQVKSKEKRMSFVEYQMLEFLGNKNQDKEKEGR